MRRWHIGRSVWRGLQGGQPRGASSPRHYATRVHARDIPSWRDPRAELRGPTQAPTPRGAASASIREGAFPREGSASDRGGGAARAGRRTPRRTPPTASHPRGIVDRHRAERTTAVRRRRATTARLLATARVVVARTWLCDCLRHATWIARRSFEEGLTHDKWAVAVGGGAAPPKEPPKAGEDPDEEGPDFRGTKTGAVLRRAPRETRSALDLLPPSGVRVADRGRISRVGEVPGPTTVGRRRISLTTEAPSPTVPTPDRTRRTNGR